MSYRFVEKPFRDSRAVGVFKLLVILLTAMGLMLSLAFWAYITKGLAKRFDDFDGVLSYLHYPYKDSFLSHTCFLHPEDLNAKIGFEKCPHAAPANDGRPVLYLWGDSNAAHLIPGIKKKYENSHDLVIRTVFIHPIQIIYCRSLDPSNSQELTICHPSLPLYHPEPQAKDLTKTSIINKPTCLQINS